MNCDICTRGDLDPTLPSLTGPAAPSPGVMLTRPPPSPNPPRGHVPNGGVLHSSIVSPVRGRRTPTFPSGIPWVTSPGWDGDKSPPGALGKLTSFLNTSLLFLASSLDVSASAVLGFLEDWRGGNKRVLDAARGEQGSPPFPLGDSAPAAPPLPHGQVGSGRFPAGSR